MDAASWSSLRDRPSGRCHASGTRREVRDARLRRTALELMRHLFGILAEPHRGEPRVVVQAAGPVFIMVSGALLLESRPGEGARAFYARRLQRIAIPLVVAHVGYLLVRFRWLHEPLTVPRVVADLLHATVYVQLYFFWIILGLYLITPLLRSALADRTRGELLVIGVAGIGFMWAVRAGAQIL